MQAGKSLARHELTTAPSTIALLVFQTSLQPSGASHKTADRPDGPKLSSLFDCVWQAFGTSKPSMYLSSFASMLFNPTVNSVNALFDF